MSKKVLPAPSCVRRKQREEQNSKCASTEYTYNSTRSRMRRCQSRQKQDINGYSREGWTDDNSTQMNPL